ncbi:MAG: hypothetical protein ACTS5I_10490 [Rhodanobacter sp.]
MPFLQILTRCYKRPQLLLANISSLVALTDPDWVQTCLIDNVGRGIGWSYTNMAAHAPLLRGEYIWILDDDDVCSRPTLVVELKQIVDDKRPDVIMVRMHHGPLGVLPDGATWQQPPQQAHIGCSAFVVRREVWQQHAGAFGDHYAGDFDFIAAVFASGASVYWHDVIASRVQCISQGKAEKCL